MVTRAMLRQQQLDFEREIRLCKSVIDEARNATSRVYDAMVKENIKLYTRIISLENELKMQYIEPHTLPEEPKHVKVRRRNKQ